MAKKPLLRLPINAQLVSVKFVKKYKKALLWKGAGMIIFFGGTPKIFFFSAA